MEVLFSDLSSSLQGTHEINKKKDNTGPYEIALFNYLKSRPVQLTLKFGVVFPDHCWWGTTETLVLHRQRDLFESKYGKWKRYVISQT